MVLKDFTERNRKFYFIIVLIIILCSFFAYYSLEYIPSNKQELNKRGFRILKQISENISEKNKEYTTRIERIIESNKDSLSNGSANSIESQIKKIVSLTALTELSLKSITTIKKSDEHEKDTLLPAKVLLKKEDTWKLALIIDYVKSPNIFKISFEGDLSNYLEPIISYRDDLFESYFITIDSSYYNISDSKKKNGKRDALIYQSGNLNFLNVPDTDSLKLGRTTVHDIDITGVSHKMFVQPMTIGNDHIILAGLVKKSNYNNQYLSVSPGLIYLASIFLLFMICSLPFLKIGLIAPTEKLSAKDVVFAGIALILGTVVFVIIITDWYISKSIKEKKHNHLVALSKEVEISALKDVTSAFDRLKYYDLEAQKKWKSSVSDSVPDFPDKLSVIRYNNFDRVYWMDSSGMQIAHWEMKNSPNKQILKINVGERNYFKKILNGESYKKGNAEFITDPVFSYSTAEFQVVLSAKSQANAIFNQEDSTKPATKKDSATVIALENRLFSVTTPIVRTGFGYCIINDSGNVLIHSDIKRSLRENLIDETNENIFLQRAIHNRQDKIIERAVYYGDEHDFLIKPIRGLPFYLVTFYNRTNSATENNHIVLFAICITLVMLILLLVGHWLSRLANQKFTKLNFTPGLYSWFKPQQNDPDTLSDISRFLAAYIVSSIAFILVTTLIITPLVCPDMAHMMWMVLFNILLMPFYAYIGVYYIKRTDVNKTQLTSIPFHKSLWKFLKEIRLPFFFLTLPVNLFILYAQERNFDFYRHALIFQLFSVIFIYTSPWLISQLRLPSWAHSNIIKVEKPKPDWSKLLSNYTWVVTLIVLLIAFIPPVTFLYYGYTEEKMQEVKTRQLQLAMDIQKRNNELGKKIHQLSGIRLLHNSSPFLDSMRYVKNVFAESDSPMDYIMRADPNLLRLKNVTTYDFLLSNIYQNESKKRIIDQVKNDASDEVWYWRKNKGRNNQLNFVYNYPGQGHIPVQINSTTLPFSKPEILKWQLTIWCLFMITGCVFIFYLVLHISRKMFLIGYQQTFEIYAAEEIFFEKFAPFIKPGRMIVIDEFQFFDKKDYNKPRKGKYASLTILDKYQECLLKKSLSIWEHKNKYNFDNTEFKTLIMVKTLKFKPPAKLHDDLLNLNDNDLWGQKAIGSLSRNFELLEKKECSRWFHSWLQKIEDPYNFSAGDHRKHWDKEEIILFTQRRFEKSYEALWKACSEDERLVLYDFAKDEFTNYKDHIILNSLIRKGLLAYENNTLRFVNKSFRNFLLSKAGSEDGKDINKQLNKSDKWDVLRMSLFITVIAAALFVFFTQEEIFKKISAALTAVVALTPMVLKLLEQGKHATGNSASS